MMKKILFGILMLFLVALVPSALATVIDCPVYTGDLEILEIRFDPDQAYEPGDTVDLEIDVENTGTLAASVDTGDLFLYVYDSDNVEIDILYPITLTVVGGPVSIAIDDEETVEATFTVGPSNYVAYDFENEHQFALYINLDDGLTNCDVSSEYPVVLDNYPRLSGITSKTATEDSLFTYTATASDDDNEAGEPVIDTLVFSLVNSPSGMSIVSSTGAMIWTPTNSYVGTNVITVKVVDGYGGEDTETFTVTVVNTNDKPNFATVSDSIVQEDIAISDIVLEAATDVDLGDSVTYSLDFVSTKPSGSTFDLTSYFDSVTRTISGWTPDKADIGELKLRLTATDSSLETDTADFTINVYPKTMCDLGEMGNALDITIDSPSDDDEFGPGDKINIEVTVENGANDDKNVIVEAVLYDIDTNKKIADVESDDENIDEDEDYKFELELQIPLDEDEEYDGDYVLYIKAYEKGKEDEQCFSDLIELDIGRESHEVIIQSMTITPSTLEPGDSFDVLIRALNTGRKDEEGVTVKLRSTDLEIDETSNARDLAKYEDSGNSYVYRFTDIKIPLSTRGKTYQLEAFVLYEDGATSTSYMDSPTFRLRNSQIVVEGEAILTDTISVGSVEETAEGVLRIPVTVTNTEGKTGLTVGLTNINWAKEVDEQAISLVKGDSGTVYFDLELEDSEEGTESFTVQFKSNGEVIDSAARSISITDDMLGSGFFGSIKGSTVLWVIGDIVLIVVAIFFVKLIFTARKKKLDIREVKL